MEKILYIGYTQDEGLLSKVIDSFINQVDKIIIINNSLIPISYKNEKVVDYIPSDTLSCEQSISYATRCEHTRGSPYVLWCHNDLISISQNIVERLIDKYEEIKDTKWGVIFGHYDHICLFNPEFNYKENIFSWNIMFPSYFGDNQRYRLMDLRGYIKYNLQFTDSEVNHIGSQTIRNNAIWGLLNGWTFPMYAELYNKLWSGSPGQETNNDPTCHNIYPL